MKRTNKKGFTIVELVIVIAVIAVLAAVLIPTFSGIIEKAHLSNDTSLVASINTAIAVEQIVTGEPNDAIEIAKIIKRYGMKLETKSKGNYLWYDIENRKVVLAGLNEEGIVLQGENPNARAVNGKGKFKEATSPESFIEGYLFITESSKDGLADAIYALRNPEIEVDDEGNKTNSLSATLAEIEEHGNSRLYTILKDFMGTTAVMTENGIAFCGNKPNAVNRVIVSSEMVCVTESAISELSSYPNVIVIDFHSDVAGIESDAVAQAMNAHDIYYVYTNKTVSSFETKIEKLIHKDKREDHIQTLHLVYVDKNGNSIKADPKPFTLGEFKLLGDSFDAVVLYGTKDNAYNFMGYSLYKPENDAANIDDTNLLKLDEDYILNDAEKLLSFKDKILTLYAIFESADADFKVNDVAYSSKSVTYMLDNGAAELEGTKIVVNSTAATLDATLIGKETATLTIPSSATLWVPCETTDYSRNESSGQHKPAYDSENKDYGTFDKDNDYGQTQLTIASNVTLVNNGYLTVDAQLHRLSSSHFGFIAEDSAVLVVNGTVENHGRLEAYGVVRTTADGEIISKDDSTVVEPMAILDLHGGTSTAVCVLKGFSPFNNYTIDSIRLPLTIEEGAIYTTYGLIEANNKPYDMEFKIADNEGTPSNSSTDNPLFLMHDNAKIVKSYKAGKGIQVTIYGDVEDCKKIVDVDIKSILTDYVDTHYSGWKASIINGILRALLSSFDGLSFENIPMPLPDFDVTVASSATLSLSNATAYKILPGSDWVVEEGGKLNLNCRMVVYDSFVLEGVPANLSARNYEDAFTKKEATFTVKGELALQDKAEFAGIIQGGANGATITVASNAKTSCSEIKEAANGSISTSGVTCSEYKVKGFSWTARFVKAGSAVPQQITAGEATYTFNGSVWN